MSLLSLFNGRNKRAKEMQKERRRRKSRRMLFEQLQTRELMAADLHVLVDESFDDAAALTSSMWETNSTNVGRIQVDNGRLAMDASQWGNSLNEAVLHLDLKGKSGVRLTFDHDSMESWWEHNALPSVFTGHRNGDGVAFSSDGQTWHRLVSLTDDFTSREFDLDAAIRDAGIEYTSDFQIKFQQFDNGYMPYDGRGFDNVKVTYESAGDSESQPKPSSSVLVEEVFAEGDALQSDVWETYSSNYGRIQVSNGRLEMDADPTTYPAPFSLNEAILEVDLAGRENVTLRFDHDSMEDWWEHNALPSVFTGHRNGDGVAFSSDGHTWHRLVSLTDDFTGREFDLDAAVQAAGIEYTSEFQIKFQQYDNYYMKLDGRAFDNIQVIANGTSETNFNQTPVLAPLQDVNVSEGQTEQVKIIATDPDGDALQTPIVTGLPAFAVFDGNTGTIDIKPQYDTVSTSELSKSYSITVSVSDGVETASQAFTLTVDHVNRPPRITSLAGVTINEGQSETIKLEATDPDGDVIQSITVTNLPDFATYDQQNRTININPPLSTLTASDPRRDFPMRVTANDGKDIASKTFIVTVVNVNQSPTLEPLDDVVLREGSITHVAISATDPDGDVLETPIVTGLPEFATFNEATGVITIAPNFDALPDSQQFKEYPITVSISDGQDQALQTFNLTVNREDTLILKGTAVGQWVKVHTTGNVGTERVSVQLMERASSGRAVVVQTEEFAVNDVSTVHFDEADGAVTVIGLEDGRAASIERWGTSGAYTKQTSESDGTRTRSSALNGILLSYEQWFSDGRYVRSHMDPSGLIQKSTFQDGRLKSVEEVASNASAENVVAIDEIDDLVMAGVARSTVISLTTQGNITETTARAFVGNQLFQLRAQLGLLTPDGSLDNSLDREEKWLPAAGGRFYVLLPDGRLTHQVATTAELDDPAKLVAKLDPAVYAQPSLLWYAQGGSVNATAVVADGGVQVSVPNPQSGEFTVAVTVVGEASRITRYFDVAADNTAYLAEFRKLERRIEQIRDSLKVGNEDEVIAELARLEESTATQFKGLVQSVLVDVRAERKFAVEQRAAAEKAFNENLNATQAQRNKAHAFQRVISLALQDFREAWEKDSRPMLHLRSMLTADGFVSPRSNTSSERSFSHLRSFSGGSGTHSNRSPQAALADGKLTTINAEGTIHQYSLQTGQRVTLDGLSGKARSVAAHNDNWYSMSDKGHVYRLNEDLSWTRIDNNTVFDELYVSNGQLVGRGESFETGRGGITVRVEWTRLWDSNDEKWVEPAKCPSRLFCDLPNYDVPSSFNSDGLSDVVNASYAPIIQATEDLKATLNAILPNAEKDVAIELRSILRSLDIGVQEYMKTVGEAADVYDQTLNGDGGLVDQREALKQAAKNAYATKVDTINKEEQSDPVLKQNRDAIAAAKTAELQKKAALQAQHNRNIKALNDSIAAANTKRISDLGAAMAERDRRAEGKFGGFGLFSNPSSWASDIEDAVGGVVEAAKGAPEKAGEAWDEFSANLARWEKAARDWFTARAKEIQQAYGAVVAAANKAIGDAKNEFERAKQTALDIRDGIIETAEDIMAPITLGYQDARDDALKTRDRVLGSNGNPGSAETWFNGKKNEALDIRSSANGQAALKVFDNGVADLGGINQGLSTDLRDIDISIADLTANNQIDIGNWDKVAVGRIAAATFVFPPVGITMAAVPVAEAIAPIWGDEITADEFLAGAVVNPVVMPGVMAGAVFIPKIADSLSDDFGDTGIGEWDNKIGAWWQKIIGAPTAIPAPPLRVLHATLNFDYDTNNFFDTQAKRELLQQAVDSILARLSDDLAAISSGSGNTWAATFINPGTGAQMTLNDLNVRENEIIIYVGGRDLGGRDASGNITNGQGGPGGYSSSGSAEFITNVATRGEAGATTDDDSTPDNDAVEVAPWGGSITFNTNADVKWHFGATTDGLASDESDFLSTALHEFVHLLGIGTADSWDRLVDSSTNQFVGTNATREYDFDGSPPVQNGGGHWRNGTTDGNREVLMDPTNDSNRRGPTELDFAALDDIGWDVLPPATS